MSLKDLDFEERQIALKKRAEKRFLKKLHEKPELFNPEPSFKPEIGNARKVRMIFFCSGSARTKLDRSLFLFQVLEHCRPELLSEDTPNMIKRLSQEVGFSAMGHRGPNLPHH